MLLDDKSGGSNIAYRAIVGSKQDIIRFRTVIIKANKVVAWLSTFAEKWCSSKCNLQSLKRCNDKHNIPTNT